MITSSLSPISVTRRVTSSSAHGDSSELIRVHSWAWPRSISLPTLTSPSRAASLLSTEMASSRLPRTTSAFWTRSGSLPTIFSFEGSKKWIIREGVKGTSRVGRGGAHGQWLGEVSGVAHGRESTVTEVRAVAWRRYFGAVLGSETGGLRIAHPRKDGPCRKTSRRASMSSSSASSRRSRSTPRRNARRVTAAADAAINRIHELEASLGQAPDQAGEELRVPRRFERGVESRPGQGHAGRGGAHGAQAGRRGPHP